MRAGGILIGIPTFGLIDVEVVSRLFALNYPVNAVIGHCWPVGMGVAEARNSTAQAAIDTDCEYVFFVDYDVVIPTDALTRLVARGAGIISGLYVTKDMPPCPLVVVDDKRNMDWTPGDVVQTDFTPMGCTLIKTEVFRQMKPPWFVTKDRQTEDTYFCRRAKEELGVQSYVDTGIGCIHKSLATHHRFFFDAETGLPTWTDADGTEKHTVAPVGHEKLGVLNPTKGDDDSVT